MFQIKKDRGLRDLKALMVRASQAVISGARGKPHACPESVL